MTLYTIGSVWEIPVSAVGRAVANPEEIRGMGTNSTGFRLCRQVYDPKERDCRDRSVKGLILCMKGPRSITCGGLEG